MQSRGDSNTFVLTLNTASGLPARVCAEWQRKSFSLLPDCLSLYRNPTTKTAAENGAIALIQYLKTELAGGNTPRISTDQTKAGPWLERFISLENNPRSARIMGEGSSYTIETIELYRSKYTRYIKGDPFCDLKMAEIEQADALAFAGRLGLKKKKEIHGGGPIAGTRTYEITMRFVRMAFKEYGTTHENWRNPFDRIKPPKSKDPRPREILEEWEIKKLFEPGVIPDPLDRALCAAMFWAGMRRGEIYGLKPEDLNWKFPMIIIRNAWQRYDSPAARSLGDPKWHKIREIAFPVQLQDAIKELWAAYGQHDFVFCDKNGRLPGANYCRRWLPRWIAAAGIDLGNRNIVPHGSRHSLASALEADGVPLRQIQDMLGHSAMKTTRRYLHDTMDHLNKMGKKIEKIAREAPDARLAEPAPPGAS
ncbi:MAG: site-specific integrase [Spirochaetaceae bacterium]|nr:site-specific integrase [Spirochaetaceae bacterium]